MGVDYNKQYEPDQLEPFFPNEIVKMVIVVLCTLALLIFLVTLPSLLSSFGLAGIFHQDQPADPSSTPAHIRPEWYFLAVYQYLKLMPREMMGMDGKTLGIFTQAIVIGMVILLPFWIPIDRAKINRKDFPRGILTCGVMIAMILLPAVFFAWVRRSLPEGYGDIAHPMFVWPVLAAVAFVVAGWLAKRTGLADAYKWLKLFTISVLLLGIQFITFIVVLGQGLSWAMSPAVGYAIGGIIFLVAAVAIIRWAVLRIFGTDESIRVKVLIAFITEGLLVFVGLTIWAMWPAGRLITEHGWHHEAKSFAFFLLLIAAAAIVFVCLVAAERRTIRRTLGPSEEREHTS